LNFELTREDYFNYAYYTGYLAPGKKAELIKSRLKIFLFYLLILLLVKFSSAGETFTTFFFFSVFMLACIYLIPLFTVDVDTRKQTIAFLENPLNHNVLINTEVTISETGVAAKDMFTESKYRWDCVTKNEETKDYYFLYLNSVQAIIIPKRILKSEIEKENLSKMLAQHIPFNAEVGHLVK